jgi:hypothetical protein
VSQYRCLILAGQQKVVSVEILDARTDDEARHEARWLFFDRGDSDGSFEVWLRDPLVERQATPVSVYSLATVALGALARGCAVFQSLAPTPRDQSARAIRSRVYQ